MKIPMEQRDIKRGDIYYADLSPAIGSEQAGLRPVIVLQNDIGNKYSPVVIVAAITSKQKSKGMKTHIKIGRNCGLDRDSVIMLEHIRTIDKSRLEKYISSADDADMYKVNKGIIVSFGLQERYGAEFAPTIGGG